ncbi:MAG: hypothetical protein E7528_01155 [Ruminococcaceae bacterium]|nr:hypothetical protein [Oscillospiraceae bacterium]
MKKIVALFLVFAMCFSFAACNSKNKICSECKEKLVGDWFSVDESETRTVEKIITITDDAKLIVDGKTYTLRFDCGFEHSSKATAYGNDGDWAYEIKFNHDTVNYLFDDSIVLQDNKAITKEYRPMSKYTVVEITEENWQNYFSTDISESFDVNYVLNASKDVWGEYTDGYIYTRTVFKNPENYAYGTELIIEYSYEVGTAHYEFNVAEEKVTNYSFIKTEEETKTITQNIVIDGDGEASGHQYMEIDNSYLSKEILLNGKCEQIRTRRPQEILRMKGWLVIKND